MLKDEIALKYLFDSQYCNLINNMIENTSEQIHIELTNISNIVEIKNISKVNKIEINKCDKLKLITNINDVNYLIIRNVITPTLENVTVNNIIIEQQKS